jgi:hypothetical protein
VLYERDGGREELEGGELVRHVVRPLEMCMKHFQSANCFAWISRRVFFLLCRDLEGRGDGLGCLVIRMNMSPDIDLQTQVAFVALSLCIGLCYLYIPSVVGSKLLYIFNPSINFVASSTPSSTLSAFVPCPMAVCAPGFPPALPPIIGVTAPAHFGPSAPAALCCYSSR